jgi:hypothetical protein
MIQNRKAQAMGALEIICPVDWSLPVAVGSDVNVYWKTTSLFFRAL